MPPDWQELAPQSPTQLGIPDLSPEEKRVRGVKGHIAGVEKAIEKALKRAAEKEAQRAKQLDAAARQQEQ